MPTTFPTTYDPLTISNILTSVVQDIQEYLSEKQNLAAFTSTLSCQVSNGPNQIQVNDPALIAQVQAGANALLVEAQEEYSSELAALGTYIAAAVAANQT